MAPPGTILELSGATPKPHAPSSSAVVMIDAKLECVTGQMPLAGVAAAVPDDRSRRFENEKDLAVLHHGPVFGRDLDDAAGLLGSDRGEQLHHLDEA